VLFDPAESMAPLSAADCARVFSTVAWSCEEVFVLSAGWIDSIPVAETKVIVSVAARVFAWHAAQWRALIPDSILLEDDRRAAPAPTAREAIALLERAEPEVRVRSLGALAENMSGAVDLLTARLSPVSDGAATRLAGFLRADLGRLCEALAS
jgi:hypothetical protein